MDFGALPPEVISGRMYSGPGSGPLLTAAAAWASLASELSSTASAYDSVISGLTGEAWSGPSSASMAAAATPYAAWMSSTGAQAEQAAVQARVAAAAYHAAFTAVVPPPVIAANRSLLMSLIATNILGQNTPAIAATELHYAEMWAQDVLAMYLYASGSASATTLAPFTEPPPTTNGAGISGQAAVVAHTAAAVGTNTQTTLSQLISMVPHALQSLAVSAPSAQATGPIISILDALSGPLSPISLFGIAGIPYLLAIQCVMLPMNGANVIAAVGKATAAGVLTPEGVLLAGESVPVSDGLGSATQLLSSPAPMVSAGVGNAGSVGRLSVPQGWTAATPAARTVAAMLPSTGPGAVSMVAADSQSSLMSDLAMGGLAGRAIGATGGAAATKAVGEATAAKSSKPTAATIIVIPPSAED